MLYYPYGETRWLTGTLTTDRGFTGQRNDATIKLLDYNARYYDPWLGRFVSADTIVPSAGNPQSLNRYSYVVGNPLKYVDPSGHRHCVDVDENGRCIAWENPRTGEIEQVGGGGGGQRDKEQERRARIQEIEWNVARGINVFFAAITIFGCVAAPSQVPPAGAPVKRGYTGNYFSPQQVGMAPIAGDAQMVRLPPPPGMSDVGFLPDHPIDSLYFVRLKNDPRNVSRLVPMAIDTTSFTSGEPTAAGGIRNNTQFWTEWAAQYPSTLSYDNLDLIGRGLSPKVNDV